MSKEMTTEDLYNYIKTQIQDDKEIVLRLLAGGLRQYEYLKFESEEKAVPPEIIIANAALDLGWGLIAEKKGKWVRGLVIGEVDYIKEVSELIEKGVKSNQND